MQYDDDLIIACPHCEQLYRHHSTLDTFMKPETVYSDGYICNGSNFVVKMVKCFTCNKFFNIKDCKEVGALPYMGLLPKKWGNTISIIGYKNSIAELEEALYTSFCNTDENEKAVRTLLLRRFNDAFRNDSEYKQSEEERSQFIENIEKLIELSKDATNFDEKILLAELYREKGDFETCMKLITNIIPVDKIENRIRGVIYNCAEVKDDKVFEHFYYY